MDYFNKLETKYKLMIGGVVAVLFLGISLRLIFKPQKEMINTHTQISSSYAINQTSESSSHPIVDEMYVDIKGAVAKPGIYKVDATMRVLNVVELAGGFLKEADDKQINLSERVSDQMVIYIPKEGEEIAEVVSSQKTNPNQETHSNGENNQLVNLNTAEMEELKTLNGIGEKKAENILRYREEKGSFKSIDELKEVDGIGEKTFEQLKSSITV